MRAPAFVVLALVVGLSGCGSADPADDGGDSPAPRESTSESDPSVGEPAALFFGDSYVVGGSYTDAEGSMAAIAARELGWEYQIRGGGGTGFTSGNAEYDIPSYPEQIDRGALDVGPVDWLVIEGGGNDRDVAPELVTEQAVVTLEAARRSHPEARVVLVGGMDPTVDDFSDSDGTAAALARAASIARVPYVDAQRWLEGRPDLVGPDFDHPLPAGHQLCGEKLAAALEGLG